MPFPERDFLDDDNDEALRRATRRLFPIIEGFRITEELPDGGQARVFDAVQLGSLERVAIKVFHRAGTRDSEAERLSEKREWRETITLASLCHPNIVRLRARDRTSLGHPCIIMDFVEGVTLKDFVGPAMPLDHTVALFLAEQLCDAIQYAHSQGSIHRDLKPTNVMVHPVTKHLTILDFGLAIRKHDIPLTEPGTFLGTKIWASPEHYKGTTDTSSDIYAFGLIYYYMLTGRLPYDIPPSAPFSVIRSIICDSPALPPSHFRNIPRDTDDIILRCLRKSPSDRFASAAEVRADLKRARAGEPVLSGRRRYWHTARQAWREYKVPLTFGGLVLASVATVAIVAAVMWHRVEAQRALASSSLKALQTALLSTDPRQAHPSDYTVLNMLEDNAPLLDLNMLPERGSQVRSILGRTYSNLGMPAMAEPLLTDVLSYYKTQRGADDVDTMEAEIDLAWNDLALGRPEAAEKHFSQILKRAPRSKVVMTVDAERGMAAVYAYRGDLERARDILLRLLNDSASALPEQLRLSLQRDIARIFGRNGELSKAEARWRDIVSTGRLHYGNEHPQLAQDLVELAFSIELEGLPTNAIPVMEEARAIQRHYTFDRRAFIRTNIILSRLSNTVADKSHAESYARLAVAECEAIAPRDPLHADAYLVLGNALRSRKSFTEARAAYTAGLDVTTRLHGTENETAATLRASLGLVEIDSGAPDNAVASLTEAVRVFALCLGRVHPHTISARKNLALAQLGARQFVNASVQLRDVLQVEEYVYPEGSLNIALTKHQLGQALCYGNVSYEDARRFCWDAYCIRLRELGDQDARTLSALCDFARACVADYDFQCAENALSNVVKSCDAGQATVPDHMRRAQLLLCVVYRKTLQYPAAISLAEALLNELRQEERQRHLLIIDVIMELASSLRCSRRYEEARWALDDARALASRLPGNNALTIALVEEALGTTLVDMGHVDEAAICAFSSLDTLDRLKSLRHIASVENYCTLAEVALAQNRIDDAFAMLLDGMATYPAAMLTSWEWSNMWSLYGLMNSRKGYPLAARQCLESSAVESVTDIHMPPTVRTRIIKRWIEYLIDHGSSYDADTWRRLVAECDTGDN